MIEELFTRAEATVTEKDFSAVFDALSLTITFALYVPAAVGLKEAEAAVPNSVPIVVHELSEDFFYALGVKSIINLKKVLRITKDTLVMEDGKKFSVPRGTYRTLSELIIKHSF